MIVQDTIALLGEDEATEFITFLKNEEPQTLDNCKVYKKDQQEITEVKFVIDEVTEDVWKIICPFLKEAYQRLLNDDKYKGRLSGELV